MYSPSTSNILELVKNEAKDLPSYLDNCDRAKSETLLLAHNVDDGTYIIRLSKQEAHIANKHYLTISVRDGSHVRHFPVFVHKNCETITYRIATDQPRCSLTDLLKYHESYPMHGYVVNNESEDKIQIQCQLKKGLNRRPTKPKLQRKDGIDEPHKHPTTLEPVCDCGLPVHVTYLPEGWSVHRCLSDDKRNGLLYFMDPQGCTSWQLDPAIDKLCTNSEYLKHGELNMDNFQRYEIKYESTGQLGKFSRCKIKHQI